MSTWLRLRQTPHHKMKEKTRKKKEEKEEKGEEEEEGEVEEEEEEEEMEEEKEEEEEGKKEGGGELQNRDCLPASILCFPPQSIYIHLADRATASMPAGAHLSGL